MHPDPFLGRLAEFIEAGGGNLDPDTVAVPASYAAALLAAGAGLESVARLDAGEGDVAFSAVRPPGHHATPTRSMGFCLLNNVAVTARALADRGERVLIVDYDAHHGNGTQDVFYGDGDVVYVSFHEFPLYPGTGGVPEMGEGDGYGADHQLPAARRGHRRRLPHRHRAGAGPVGRLLAADLAAGLGRLRRPPPRSDHRPRPGRRGLRRLHP